MHETEEGVAIGSSKRRVILLHHARVPRRLAPALEDAWVRAVGPDRSWRIRALRNPEDRAATLLGLALLVDCARSAALDPPNLGSLVQSVRGRPEWPGGPDFSISHAAGWCACALASGRVAVGIDLEAHDAVTARQLRLVTDGHELVPPSTGGLSATEVWVTKEAVVKAQGTGIAEVARVRTGWAEAIAGDSRYAIARPSIAPGVAAAVATSEPCELVVRERDGMALLAVVP